MTPFFLFASLVLHFPSLLLYSEDKPTSEPEAQNQCEAKAALRTFVECIQSGDRAEIKTSANWRSDEVFRTAAPCASSPRRRRGISTWRRDVREQFEWADRRQA